MYVYEDTKGSMSNGHFKVNTYCINYIWYILDINITVYYNG